MVGSAAVTAAGGVRGFPAALTSFIGRDGSLRDVAALLEHHRLVTVTGPGGAGKTRLADQVARRAAGPFADGAWLVELALEWSYQLLDETGRRVFRALSVFPGPFTLEAAEAVAGDGAELAVLHLVDCSLLVPPRAGPDGRARYSMLETLRAYGTRLVA